MSRSTLYLPYLLWGLLVSMSTLADAGGRRRADGNPTVDPMMMDQMIDWSQFDSPWGPQPTFEYGAFIPTGGTWEDMLKSGPTFASAIRWKHADFTGDLLPPSSTYISLGQRYVFLKDEEDVQVYAPGGYVGDVGNMRLYMVEAGLTQRFIGPIRRGLFVDLGGALGMGGANGSLTASVPNPAKDPLFVSSPKEDAFLIRGELNAGAGVQLNWIDFKFSFATGLSGTSALSGHFRGQTDISARIGGTIYLFQ